MKHTLQLSFPLGQTLALALLILGGMIVVLEIGARLPWVDSHVPTAIGSVNPYFDTKIGELDYLVEQQGPIDCLFIGSSVVNSGILPVRFENAYRDATNQPIRCYNFAIPGVTASGAAKLADLVIDRYHPAC